MKTTDSSAHTAQYFTAQDYFAARFAVLGRRLALTADTPEQYAIWKAELRARLGAILGLPTMQPCAADPRVVERTPMDGYLREKILLQTEPGVWMPCYVLLPGDLQPDEQRPAVIAPHGHASCGKYAVAGRTDIAAIAEYIAKHNYDYGIQMVRAGFIVFCPDARGFGERREVSQQGDTPQHMLNSSCFALNHMALPLGQTVTGMWTWDLMRLADYVATRPECQSGKLGCAGLSGGGLQTLWFAALDDRVSCAVVSGYYYGYKESLLDMHMNCSCNYVPHLWELADMGDIGALIAPRPLFIETGDQDPLNGASGVANVRAQVEITRQAYTLFDAADTLVHHIFPGEHMWCGVQALPWLKKRLC